MTQDKKINELSALLDDYHDILWADPEVRNNICYLIGRFIKTGEDISDKEVDTLKEFLHNKVEKYVKDKGN